MKKAPLIKVLVIAGPTASGKSDLAVKLAKQLNGEIISADSRQVYKGLDIGTGKITKREMQGIPHHLLDVAKLSNRPSGSITRFNVADYQKLAQAKIQEITGRGKLPIICGGTGLYIQAALGELVLPNVPPDLKLRKKLERWSTERLFKKLQALDPQRASKVDKHNPRRLIRAIEITQHLELTGGQTSCLGKCGIIYNSFWVGLNPGKEILQEKIKHRLEKRLKQGLIEEVQNLHLKQKISWQSLEELGLEYRYVAEYLRPQKPRQTGPEREKIAPVLKQLETAIWHYAKRQMTWFKRDARINWLAPEELRPENLSTSKLIRQIRAWRSSPRLNSTGTTPRSRKLGGKQNRVKPRNQRQVGT